MTSALHIGHAGPVATLTLTAKKGSLPPAFWDELTATLEKLGRQGERGAGTRALIIRGQDNFSAGLDLAATRQVLKQTGDFWEVVAPMQRALDALAAAPFATIAAIHSHCIGAGLELAAACDLRLCSADARFSLPEVRLGLVADLGGLQRLPGLIGRGRTAHLALTGTPVDARTAERWGLVTATLDTPQELYAHADALAADLAGLDAYALRGTKQVLRGALPHAEGLRQAGELNASVFMTPERPHSE